MKIVPKALLGACMAFSMASSALGQALYDVRVFNLQYPSEQPVEIKLPLNAAAALVQAGVAAPIDPGAYGLLAHYQIGSSAPAAAAGTLDFSNPANSGLIM